MFRTIAIAVALAAVGVAAAAAPPPPAGPAPTAVRGTLTAVAANAVTVRDEHKAVQTIALAPDWRVSVLKPVAIDKIQPGSFIGTAEMPTREGAGRSLEVHVFPPGVKMGEGHYPWTLRSGSMMTNGTVGKVVAGKTGSRELDVSYSYGQRHITVPANVPVVEITPGERGQLHVGQPVFLVARKGADGRLVANAISIGANGAKPPM